MTPYIVIFSIICLVALLYDLDIYVNPIIRFWTYIALSTIIVLLAGFRLNTGYDYGSYYSIFNEVKNSHFNSYLATNPWSIEPAYLILNYIFRFLSFEGFLLLLTIFIVGSKLVFIYKYSDKPFVSLIIYFSSVYIVYDFGVIREAIALAIGIWSYKYFFEKRYLNAFIIVAIASIFHFSGLMFLTLAFIDKKPMRLWKYILLLAIGILGSFLPLVNIVGKGLGAIGLGGYAIRIEYYAMGIIMSKQQIYLSIIKRACIWLAGILIFWANKNRKNTNVDYEDNINYYSNVFYISIIMALFFVSIPNIAARGIHGLIMSNMFLYPLFVKSIQKSNNKAVVKAIFELIFLSVIILDSALNMHSIISLQQYSYKSWLF